jgi:transposase
LDTHPTFGVFFMSKYTTQFKLSVITAFLERGRGFRFIADQFQMDPTLLRRWVEAYRLHGDASLQVSAKGYSPEFKLSVLQHMWRENLSFRRVAAAFNLGSSTQVGRWQQQYYSGGYEALESARKGPHTVMTLPPAKPPTPESTNDEDLSHAELLLKLRKLQVENAWLKKLKEHREEKKRREKATRKKPS